MRASVAAAQPRAPQLRDPQRSRRAVGAAPPEPGIPRSSGGENGSVLRTALAPMLAGLGLLGCASVLGPEPAPRFPPAERRQIDLYGEPEPSGSPLESGKAAVARALAEPELVRHLRAIDAKYSGRRRSGLLWTAMAAFDEEAPESGSEEESADPSALRAGAVARDGGFWRVEVASDVRETQIYYVCRLDLSAAGELLRPFESRRDCGWENR